MATLTLGMSGLDETAGSDDDYTLVLTYAGLTNACDVVLDFDDTETGFAVCKVALGVVEKDLRRALLTLR